MSVSVVTFKKEEHLKTQTAETTTEQQNPEPVEETVKEPSEKTKPAVQYKEDDFFKNDFNEDDFIESQDSEQDNQNIRRSVYIESLYNMPFHSL